ncbi:PAAR domain-containing protein [Caballeronia sp. DA-9]|uniref:PAAR domain-containing protein n=1 Tax=Caballeronia sp. DA-9 TaxID=3436237 RepID=UPI003F6628EF
MFEHKSKKPTCLFVTIGSGTRDGGCVTRVTMKAEYKGLALARVGDVVTYDDGSEAIIIDGAGFAAAWEDKPIALVGSRLSNGDTITETLQDGFGITVRDGEPIPGLFDPAYTLPPMVGADGAITHA